MTGLAGAQEGSREVCHYSRREIIMAWPRCLGVCPVNKEQKASFRALWKAKQGDFPITYGR